MGFLLTVYISGSQTEIQERFEQLEQITIFQPRDIAAISTPLFQKLFSNSNKGELGYDQIGPYERGNSDTEEERDRSQHSSRSLVQLHSSIGNVLESLGDFIVLLRFEI